MGYAVRGRYGARPPEKDFRDYKLTKTAKSIALPAKYSTLDKIGYELRIKNQNQVSSCVAHATSSILEYYGHNDLSTNFIYGLQNKEYGREWEGMLLRDACGIVKKYGDMRENDCPGNVEVPKAWSKAEVALSDGAKAATALEYRIKSYVSLSSQKDIKVALYQYGPVLASVNWYDGYVPDAKGVIRANKTGESGYHAIMIYGWDETGFLCQNSWGRLWGKNGRFTLPYTIKIEEAFSLVDDELNGTDIKAPKKNWFTNLLYKALNAIVNFLIRIFLNLKN